MVETVHSVKLAKALDRHWALREGEGTEPLRVLLQVNTCQEKSEGGRGEGEGEGGGGGGESHVHVYICISSSFNQQVSIWVIRCVVLSPPESIPH